jgi:alkylation response protein AidB-like acyl-CoA dehydrogenase
MTPTPANRFRSDLRDIRFTLFDLLQMQEVLGRGPYAAWSRDEVDMVLGEVDRFVKEVTGPLDLVGDRVGCHLEGGRVHTPPGFREAWQRLYQEGWYQLSAPEAYGGQGAPLTMHIVVAEQITGSNCSFGTYPGLALGAAEVIHAFGTKAQKERYLANLYGGASGGTMCLTEPHAGSDVGSARTGARRLPDGTYAIRGTKMFITAGDHDLTDNIIHLVLARVEGAPAGTKGLSLFIVPKLRSDGTNNDVTTGSLEHKMGLSGSATAVLHFGENDGCVGELIGTEENVGMGQMFRLMNGARLGVALQGLGVASTAYLNALAYARDRKQGAHVTRWKDPTAPRVSILEHPDVRRMLLDMKARVEGMRALVYKVALHKDRALVIGGSDDQKLAYHQGQVELFTPVVKSWSSDQAFRVCETAIQVYGGAGYVKDHPVEQHCRDAKVFSIYEGTNHIQAMDLVGRKLGMDGGQAFRAFLGDVSAFVAAQQAHPTIGPQVQALGKAADALGAAALRLLGWFQAGQLQRVPLAANRFLEMLAEVAVGWLLLQSARIASDLPPDAFHQGKIGAARYFALNVLPETICKAKILASEDTCALDIPDQGFGP